MLSNNGLCLHAAARVIIFIYNGSIILPGFKFTELHALTLAGHSHALLILYISRSLTKCIHFLPDLCTTDCLGYFTKECSGESDGTTIQLREWVVTFSTSQEAWLHFSLICTPQAASDISLKSALENLMKEPSSFMSKVSSAGSVERKVDSTISSVCVNVMSLFWMLCVD